MDKISEEVLLTERSYVTSLRALVSLYLQPLRAAHEGAPVLEEDTVKLIFGNVDQVLEVNELFLADLEEKMKHWEGLMDVSSHEAISVCIRRYVPFFKIYGGYSAGYMKAIETIALVSKSNEAFAEWLAACNQKSGSTLPSLLILPVQRVPRYKLLV